MLPPSTTASEESAARKCRRHRQEAKVLGRRPHRTIRKMDGGRVPALGHAGAAIARVKMRTVLDLRRTYAK